MPQELHVVDMATLRNDEDNYVFGDTLALAHQPGDGYSGGGGPGEGTRYSRDEMPGDRQKLVDLSGHTEEYGDVGDADDYRTRLKLKPYGANRNQLSNVALMEYDQLMDRLPPEDIDALHKHHFPLTPDEDERAASGAHANQG